MSWQNLTRREWVRGGFVVAAAMAVPGACAEGGAAALEETRRGAQRLSLERLRSWEALGYGMFIHYGMSTFDGKELSDGRAHATLYAPDVLDVDQWVSVARDAGMRYAVLTAKHVAGHCLWPSRHTAYTVANSTDKTDVCLKFVDACRERYLPGEVCDPIGKDWFWVEGDAPRPDEKLLEMLQLCHGRIPEPSVQALLRLRKNAGL